MNKEIKTTLKKTVKIAGVTCLAAGAVAIVTSSAALKAIGEGSKYLVNSVKKIAKEKPETENTVAADEENYADTAVPASGEEFISQEDFAEEEIPAEEAKEA